MKVIFLDIDGVMVTGNHLIDNPGHEDGFGHGFDRNAIHELGIIVETTDAKIVISSAWRIMGGLPAMRALWKERELPGQVIDVTPNFGDRGDEIKTWLDTTGRERGVEQWVVVDDDIHDLGRVSDKLVVTSFRYGLTRDRTLEIIRILEERVGGLHE